MADSLTEYFLVSLRLTNLGLCISKHFDLKGWKTEETDFGGIIKSL